MLRVWAVVLGAVWAAVASPPLLPDIFVATFTNPLAPLQPLTGTWYYDYPSAAQRVDGGNQASCNRVRSDGEYATRVLVLFVLLS